MINQYLMSGKADRSILAPSRLMSLSNHGEGWGWAPKGSRGDPPIASGSRGHPPWIFVNPWGDRPRREMTINSALSFAVCFS